MADDSMPMTASPPKRAGRAIRGALTLVAVAALAVPASGLGSEVSLQTTLSASSTVLGHEVTVEATGTTDQASLQLWIRQDPEIGACSASPSDAVGPRTYSLANGDQGWTDVGPGPFDESFSFVQEPGRPRLCAWLVDPAGDPAIVPVLGATTVLTSPAARVALRKRRSFAGLLLVPRGWRYSNRSYPSDHSTEFFLDPSDNRMRIKIVDNGCWCNGYTSARRYLNGAPRFAGKRWAAWRWQKSTEAVDFQTLWTGTLVVLHKGVGQTFLEVSVPAHQKATVERIFRSALASRR